MHDGQMSTLVCSPKKHRNQCQDFYSLEYFSSTQDNTHHYHQPSFHHPTQPLLIMAAAKVSFHLPSRKSQSNRYFSVCPSCQKDHLNSALGGEQPNALSLLSSDSADPKYDIINHAVDEQDEAQWTGVEITREHIVRTWRAKVVKACGEETGCAKVLLAQVYSTHL